jgi:hypothetical protein
LSLLSILPDGLSNIELIQSSLPIPNILQCKATLLATSLAFEDAKKRFWSLMPVREYIQQFLPPSQSPIHSLCKHFYLLLELYPKYDRALLTPVVSQILLNMANIQEVLQRGLHEGNPNLIDTIGELKVGRALVSGDIFRSEVGFEAGRYGRKSDIPRRISELRYR